jgi:hypothetical protein
MLASCAANRPAYNQLTSSLSLGMGKQQAKMIMGAPRRTDVNADRERWIYWNPTMIGFTLLDNENLADDRVVITFREGEIVSWGNQTYADDIIRMSQEAQKAALDVYKDGIKIEQTIITKEN